MSAAPRADRAEIARAVAVLHEPGTIVELRAPKAGRRGTISGYFNDPTKFVDAAAALSGTVAGVYALLNPARADLLARACNRVQERAAVATTDADTLRRRWILLDFDAIRAAGISSTDAEHTGALAAARNARAWLVATLGFPANSLVLADSGNGAHLLVRVELPNDDATRALVQRCLEAVALYCGTDTVQVDTTVGNAARIVKVYGTLAAKGDSMDDRRHRLARLLEVPDAIGSVPLGLLERLAALRPVEPARERTASSTRRGDFDVRAWLAGHGLTIRREKPWVNGGTVLELAACGFTGAHEHHHGEAAVILCASGMLLYTCRHQTCAGKEWADLRTHLDGPRAHARRVEAAAAPWPPDEEPPPARPDDPAPGAGVLVSEIVREPVDWLWPGYLPRGKLVILEGPPDVGKTTLTLDLAARVSRGTAMPNSLTTRLPAGVVVLSAEDGLGDTVRPRLEEAGAALDRIVTARPEELPTLDRAGLAYIRRLIERVAAQFVCIDPLMAFVPDAVDTYKDHASRRLLRTLAAFAAELETTLLVVRHLRKGAIGTPTDAGGGSIAYSAAARVVLLAARDPPTPDRYVLATAKNNLSPRGPALSYALVPAGGVVAVSWHGESTQDAAALLTVPLDTDERRGVEEAVVFLETTLTAGPQPAADVRREARKLGIADRTLDRAKQRLRIRARRESVGVDGAGRWMWVWPDAPPAREQARPADPEGRQYCKDANPVAPPGSESGALGALAEPAGLFRPSEVQGRHRKEVASFVRCECGGTTFRTNLAGAGEYCVANISRTRSAYTSARRPTRICPTS